MLGSPEKRRQYDAQGHQSFTSSSQHGGSHGFNFNMHDFFKEFDSFHQAHHNAHHNAHHQAHQRAHQRAHQQAHQGFHFDFGSLFDDEDDLFGTNIHSFGGDSFGFENLFDGFGDSHHTVSKHSNQHCRTVTRREGNTVSTITECH